MKRIHFIGNLMIGLLSVFSLGAVAEETIWTDIYSKTNLNQVERVNAKASDYRLVDAKMAVLERRLYNTETDTYELMLPLPDGSSALFRLDYSPVYQPELEQKYPSIRTFKGYQIDKPANSGRFDITPHGFHGMFKVDGHSVFIDPLQRGNNGTYISYYKRNAIPLSQPRMDKVLHAADSYSSNSSSSSFSSSFSSKTAAPALAGETLKTYRIAIAAAAEYTAFHGGTKVLGQAAIVTMINRVNEVYQVDLSTKLEIIGNNDTVVYTDAATDPFDNTDGDLNTNLTVMENNIGSANYDIGHVVNTGGGGLAFLGVVCSSSKAGGMTGSGSPVNDPFVIDFVAHEVGHQFGGEHSYNGGTLSCTTRSPSNAYEPGSGATVMAYAGICGEEDIQSNSDAYFHSNSIDQMMTHIVDDATCATTTLINNEPPVVAAGSDFTIPANTPFKLTGSATDVDGDSLTYVWEQFDLGTQSTSVATMVDDGSRPIFRSWTPTSSPSRYLPRLSDVIANTTVIGESYPTTDRTMNFRLTVRDGKGNTGKDTMRVTVDRNSAGFAVTAPAGGDTWAHSTNPVVSWVVSGTNTAPVSCSTVDILLSTDSGATFDQTVISGTTNDGSEAINVPALESTTARLLVMCQGNIFFAVNSGVFTINGVNTSAEAPVITGQSTLAVDEDNSLTVGFSDLTVTDGDSDYPTGFSMTLTAGSNYTVSGQVITPNADYSGTLTVPVKVNDGSLDSNSFDLTVTVNAVNDAPVISGQQGISTTEDSSETLSLSRLTITDPDNDAADWTLTVMMGNDYTVSGLTVTPAADFNGTLTVPVKVSDGTADSELFNVSITVAAVNDAPVIASATSQSINENQALSITLSMLDVTDVDNSRSELTVMVMAGENYNVIGTTITPNSGFVGSLTVGVKVNDGSVDSNTVQMAVTVAGVNDAPVINGAQSVSAVEDQSVTLNIDMLDITDPDNTKLQMTMTVMAGDNYSVSGFVVTPDADFAGVLSVPVKVNDGQLDSNIFNVTVNVTGVNDAPIITDVAAQTMNENASLMLTTAMLSIVDVDNSLAQQTLVVMPGDNFTLDGTTVMPTAEFNGTLSVSVKVNDGALDSNIVTMTITVTAVNDAPVISGSTASSVDEDQSITLALSTVDVSDIDNSNDELSLQVLAGDNYTVDGMTVMPAADFNGELMVNVTVSDGTNTTAVHQVMVTVNPVNDNPVAANDTLTVEENSQSNSIAVMSNDTDVDGDSLTLDSLVYSGTGAASIQGESIVYVPANNFDGTESLTYTISDGNGGTATAQLSITVTPRSGGGGGSLPVGLLVSLLALIFVRRTIKR